MFVVGEVCLGALYVVYLVFVYYLKASLLDIFSFGSYSRVTFIYVMGGNDGFFFFFLVLRYLGFLKVIYILKLVEFKYLVGDFLIVFDCFLEFERGFLIYFDFEKRKNYISIGRYIVKGY